MVDQINFPGKYNERVSCLYFADVNNDGNKEVYGFTFGKDSLYLNWIQLTPEISKINTLPVCKINTYDNGLTDYNIRSFTCIDLNHDGKKELVFIVDGGYSIVPRQIFKVDISTKKVVASENSGSGNWQMHFNDLDGDGKREIIVNGCVSPIRPQMDLPYNTPAPYLKVLDSNLHYLFPPVKFFEGILSYSYTYVVSDLGKKELLSVFLSKSAECVPFRAYKLDLKGNRIDSLNFKGADRNIAKYVFQNEKGNFITQIKPSEFLEFNSDLKVAGIYKTGNFGDLFLVDHVDINEDGEDEMIFLGASGKTIHLFSDDFKWQASIPLDATFKRNCSDYKIDKNQFYINTNKGYQIYSFQRNPYHFLQFPVYVGIYLLSVLLIFLFQKLIESRLKAQYELKNRVQELQLKTFRNQLDPHFIFNTFNTIASVIKQGKNDEAYGIFMKFSKLFRLSLKNTEEVLTTLKDEVTMVNNYIEIQKFRFKDVFEYRVHIAEDVDVNMEIPKMLIQVHIENAIRHGLIPKGSKGRLEVNIRKEQNKISIEITDNGIGRIKARELGTGNTGIGIKTMSEFIDLHNQQLRRKITQEFIDLYEDREAAGTKVRIIIPF